MEDKELRQVLKGIAGRDLEQRKNWYSPAAASYHAVRPKYPPALIEAAFKAAQLSSRARLLEIGCGPGTATTCFAALGCRLVCLEPNPEFCALARSTCRIYPGVEVIHTSFEEWDLQADAFDAVLAASSMHWIPPEIGYPKASRALRIGGHMILLWNKELQPCPSIREAFAAIYGRHAPSLWRVEDRQSQEAILSGLGRMMLDSGCFENLVTETLESSLVYTADQYIALLGTYSAYLQLEPPVRDALFAALKQCILEQGADAIHLSCLSAYQVARKRSGSGASV